MFQKKCFQLLCVGFVGNIQELCRAERRHIFTNRGLWKNIFAWKKKFGSFYMWIKKFLTAWEELSQTNAYLINALILDLKPCSPKTQPCQLCSWKVSQINRKCQVYLQGFSSLCMATCLLIASQDVGQVIYYLFDHFRNNNRSLKITASKQKPVWAYPGVSEPFTET